MPVRVLIIGGYGNFGRFISESLSRSDDIHLIIAGRSHEKAEALSRNFPSAEAAFLDIDDPELEVAFSHLRPQITIHASGPFQGQDYRVAKACAKVGSHYIDLADARSFVSDFSEINELENDIRVSLISGASSVPCLSAAVIDEFAAEFEQIVAVDYGITTAQRTTRGLATTAAILSYVGRPFFNLQAGEMQQVHGWQGLKLRRYRSLGWRWLSQCDVPDLSLFPRRYPTLQSIRFSAGIEVGILHLGLWGVSWLVRLGLIRKLERTALYLLRTSRGFDWLGTDESGFHMTVSGTGTDGAHKQKTFELIAKSGHGPYIPCMPAILLAQKLVAGDPLPIGAMPCLGLITLEEYLQALKELDIEWRVS